MTVKHIDPTKIQEVLLRGETTWFQVDTMTPGFWRLDDGTGGTRGRRGWIIVLDDGTEIVVGAEAVDGVR